MTQNAQKMQIRYSNGEAIKFNNKSSERNMKKLFFTSILTILFSFSGLNAQILKPGDGIRLKMLNITDKISGDYFVQKDSKIQLPYIGFFRTDSVDFTVLKNKIIAAYDSIYTKPELSVQPLYKINVFGEVVKPGIYYATGYETVTDILALAGGETTSSDLDDIYITRNGTKLNIDAEEILEDGKSLNDIGVKAGDKIFVPRSFWSKSNDASIVVSALAVVAAIIGIFVK